MEELTKRQRETLEWIKSFIKKNGMPPTVREIGEAFGIKSSSVFDLLKTLERKKILQRGKLGARSLILREAPEEKLRDTASVPVLGRIAAGRPIEAIEHAEEFAHMNKDLLRTGSVFALKVVGKSMIDAGILDGDIVIIRQQNSAENGDIVVALINNEATLKRFYKEGKSVILKAENKSMRPLRVKYGEFKIQGKLISLQRIYRTKTT